MAAFFQIADQSVIYNERIAIILGVTTLAFGLAAFASCKTIISLFNHFGWGNPTGNKTYRSFYRYHSYYWWLLGVFLVAHVFVAIFHTGLPQAGDPDAGIHWIILGFGTVSGLSALVQFSSCRICIRWLSRLKPEISLKNRSFNLFLKYHSYYWLVFSILVASHFAFGYYHAGIWPV